MAPCFPIHVAKSFTATIVVATLNSNLTNGDITDPPVASDNPAPAPIRYATACQSESALSDSDIFCALCLKNQHLYTSSLAQYHVNINNNNQTEQNNNDSDYYKFRQDLEKRYPQVCEKCEPAVLLRMKAAGKTAKSDHLRFLMDKTRTGQLSKSKSSLFTIQTLGRTLWNIGFYGQLIWSVTNIISCIIYNSSSNINDPMLDVFMVYLRPIIVVTASRTQAFRALLCTICSAWWCPKTKNHKKDFTTRITGIKTWYLFQVITICLRTFFYYLMALEPFSLNPLSSMTIGAHILMSVVTILISSRATGSLKVNVIPLWSSESEKIILRPQTRSALDQDSKSLSDVLNEIGSNSRLPQTRTVTSTSLTSHATTMDPFISNISSTPKPPQPQLFSTRTGHQNSTISSFGRKIGDHMLLPAFDTISEMPTRTTPSLLQMSEEEARSYLRTGEVPNTHTYEEMDWQSTQSSHRAFNPRPKTNVQQFNHTPVSNKPSPFWFRIPAAPTTPAQRLRNPPNQPNLQIPQEKTKQNFFQKMIRPEKDDSEPKSASKFQNTSGKYNLELSQPKFFPPEVTGEAENMLASLLTDVKLDNTQENLSNAWSIFGNLNLTLSILIVVVAPVFCAFFIYTYITAIYN
ncbi:hypothetical protein OnM2_052014 [Erysiphe neolycopersici]|uniref:Ima1 N-terminal domain-containing protein n=1 Tax=Erysiphe neolycopersici TaxID=212602 RepID=A0A420HSB8_9PEZI|nr:hypothetical protein OnM2_052014 [Erysiphe neolycopersici]